MQSENLKALIKKIIKNFKLVTAKHEFKHGSFSDCGFLCDCTDCLPMKLALIVTVHMP